MSDTAEAQDIAIAKDVEMTQPKKETTSNFKSFTSGGVGGVAAVLVGQ